MFYPWYEWQRGLWSPVLEATAWAARPAQLIAPLQLAGEDLARRLARAGEPVESDLGAFVRGDVGGPFDSSARELGPFATLWRFRGPRGGGAPVVLVPPSSGYACGVTSPLIATMLRHRPVLALDWKDARLVPPQAGPFGLGDQVAAVERAVADAGPGAIVVGLSQSVTAAVAGAALAAEESTAPGALVLLAGPFDTRGGKDALSLFLRNQPLAAIEAQFTTFVPRRYPGAGRRVYPGLLHLFAYAFGNSPAYLEMQAGLIAELVAGEPGERAREHRDLHSLADVPAELFLDTISAVYREHGLVTNRLAFHGRRVDLAALEGVQLLTVEMTADEFVGKGQVHAAVDHLRHGGARRVTVEGGRHHEVFTGERFFAAVAPHLDHLMEAA
ncbi:MAG: hypothetical protein ACLFU0_11970 [Alphaproteobacteria bacterium]